MTTKSSSGSPILPVTTTTTTSYDSTAATTIVTKSPIIALSPKIKTTMKSVDMELPNNVNTEEELSNLPYECLSGDRYRPLRHIDDKGNEYYYSLQPNKYIVLLILIVETIERFSYYGVYYTLTLFLTGVYDTTWNAGLTSVEASSYVSTATAVAYTTPFIGAILADSILGDYTSILIGSITLYLPGLFLVALTTIPGLFGETFNKTILSIGVLVLWPLGSGIIKSIINVFGAKQFHPLLQSAMVESYYVSFYTSINIGALAGITILPILCQHNVTIAYMVPAILLSIGILVFLSGTKLYVKAKPRHDLFSKKQATSSSESTIPLTSIFRISLLIVPFCIAYSQMPTTFIVQGTVMRRAFGFIDAATMASLDALSVLVAGYITGTYIYPSLARRNYKIKTTHKFAIGSFFGALSILWALCVEGMIKTSYWNNQGQISVLWQSPSYILIGIGEIFAVSAAYEAAFSASAPQTKALASAINIFCVGGIPNVLCIALYHFCQGWFRNTHGDTNISNIDDYVTAHVGKYFWILVLILVFGIVLNTLPPVCDFVDSIERKAADLIKTPVMRRPESTPLLGKKFGEQKVLYKMGSMRAGPSLSHTETAKVKKAKYSYVSRLYKPAAERQKTNKNDEEKAPLNRLGSL